jgi:hypothetical protein
MRSDHEDVYFDNLYSTAEMVSYNEAEFRKALRDLPCCTTNKDGTLQGGTINIVIVADGEDLLRVLIRSGWNETASTESPSSMKKDITNQIPESYRYKPLEPLYYYGRPQDASFREPRVSGFERNKLRLWLSPMRFEGQEVWVGQVSREYGKESSGRPVQKKLDFDEVRGFLLQNLWYSQGMKKFGFVKVDNAASTISQPKKTFRGTTYISDGYVAVIWLSGEPVSLSDVEAVNWEIPLEERSN